MAAEKKDVVEYSTRMVYTHPDIEIFYDMSLDDNYYKKTSFRNGIKVVKYSKHYEDAVRKHLYKLDIKVQRGDVIFAEIKWDYIESKQYVIGLLFIDNDDPDDITFLTPELTVDDKCSLPREFTGLGPLCTWWGNPYRCIVSSRQFDNSDQFISAFETEHVWIPRDIWNSLEFKTEICSVLGPFASPTNRWTTFIDPVSNKTVVVVLMPSKGFGSNDTSDTSWEFVKNDYRATHLNIIMSSDINKYEPFGEDFDEDVLFIWKN